MMQKDIDLYELATEITGIAMIISGLANQLDNNKTDTLTPSSMSNALYGVQSHLRRIACDLENKDT